MGAIEIRKESHHLALLEICGAVYIFHFGGNLMSEDPRVVEVRLCTLESMEVGATNTDPPDLQKCVIFCQRWFWKFTINQVSRRITNQGFHHHTL
jgi:hypothetical protein